MLIQKTLIISIDESYFSSKYAKKYHWQFLPKKPLDKWIEDAMRTNCTDPTDLAQKQELRFKTFNF